MSKRSTIFLWAFLLCWLCHGYAHAKWFDNDWGYRIKLTIDDDKVNGDLSNFPVYVDLGDLNGTGFFNNVSNGGVDIRVTKSNGTAQVAREVVELNKVTKTGELHFIANGTLSSTSNSDWYLYYGNPLVSEPSALSSFGATKVWTNNYVGVWHMNQDPSQGGARQFTAANSEYFTVADNASLSTGDIDFTIAAWVNFDTLTGNHIVVAKGNIGTTAGEFGLRASSGNGFYFNVSNGSAITSINTSLPETGRWYFLTVWHDAIANTLNLQIDNNTIVSQSYSGGVQDVANAFRLGDDTSGARYLDGKLSKIGFWKRALSAAEKTWLYNTGSGRLYGALGEEGTNGASLKTNLISYWNLNEASGNAIDSHGSNNLTDNNTVTAAGGPTSSRALASNGITASLVGMDFNDAWSGDTPDDSPQYTAADSSTNGNHGLMMLMDVPNARKTNTPHNSFDPTTLDSSTNTYHGWLMNYLDFTRAYDQTNNGRHGTLANFSNPFNSHSSDIPTQLNGDIANSLIFTAQNHRVNITSINLGGSSKTLASWIKTTSTDATKNYTGNAALNVFGDTSGSVTSGFGVHGGKVQYSHYTNGGPWASVTGVTNVNDGNWHHIAITHDDSTNGIKLYVDGVEDANGDIAHHTTSDAVNIYGDGYNPGNDGFIGSLTGGIIYNSVLSPAQIASLANGDDVGTPLLKYNFNFPRSRDVPAGSNGYSMLFDGSDDMVQVNDSSLVDLLEFTDKWTVSARFKMSGAGDANQTIFAVQKTTTNKASIMVRAGDIIANTYNGAFTTKSTAFTDTSSWHEVVMTNNGGTVRAWLDGTEMLGATTGGTGASGYVLIGGGDTSGGDSFGGRIDDVRIFDVVKSPTAAVQIYNGDDTSSMIAQYKFDEANLRNLPALNNGTSMDFDGTNDYLSVPHKSFMNSDDMSVSMWVNLDAHDTSGTMFMHHQSGTGSGGFEFWSFTDGRLRINPNNGIAGSTSAALLQTGLWNQIGFTRNGDTNTWKLYLNGAKVTDNVQATDITDTTGILRIADYAPNASYVLNGKVDDVRIYNTIKTPEEMLSIYQGTNVSNGLLAHWKLDENSTRQLDELGAGTSLDFDGSDDYVLSNGQVINEVSQLTMSMWVKRNGGTGVRRELIGLRDPDSNGWGPILHYETDNTLRCSIQDFSTNQWPSINSSNAITDSDWHHLLCAWKRDAIAASDLRIYVDGVDMSDDSSYVANSYSVSTAASNTKVAIGANDRNTPPSANNFFLGKIDDVRIYSQNKSPEQVYSIYQGANDTNGIVSHWKFDDGPNLASNSGARSLKGDFRGSMDFNDSVNGKLGTALDFDGTNDFIAFDNSVEINGISDNIATISAWAKSSTAGTHKLILSTYDGTVGHQIYYRNTNRAAAWGNVGGVHQGTTDPTDGSWYYVNGVWDGTNATLYLNNASEASGASTFGASSRDYQIGTECSGLNSTTCSNYFLGKLDEIRFSNTNRSTNWIKTEYNNQNSSNTFYIVGPQESQGGLFDWLIF